MRSEARGKPTPKSLILVTVDSLRADHVGFMGYSKPTTPFLDALADESCVLRGAITAGAPTYYSLPAILASRHPLDLGRDIVGIAPDEMGLASYLRKQGYVTACFSAANPYVSRGFGYQEGFDVFEDFLGEKPTSAGSTAARPARWRGEFNRRVAELSRGLGPLGGLYDELYFQYCQRIAGEKAVSFDQLRRFPAADVIVDYACRWLKSISEKPFFLWLHLMDPHAPYYPVEQALHAFPGRAIAPLEARYLNSYWNRSDVASSRLQSKKKDIVNLYDAAISWVDSQLSRLVQTLKLGQRWNDCALAVTADHGEEFLDHGGRFHPPIRLNEELIHVPLILRVPGVSKRESRCSFSLLNLAPTLLDAVGAGVPPESAGESYWEKLKEGSDWADPCIAEAVGGCTNPFDVLGRQRPRIMAIREGRYKMHLRFETREASLIDLESDPGEQFPIPLHSETPVRRRLLEIAADHLRRAVNQRDTPSRLKSKLRELQLQWPQSALKAEYAAS